MKNYLLPRMAGKEEPATDAAGIERLRLFLRAQSRSLVAPGISIKAFGSKPADTVTSLHAYICT